MFGWNFIPLCILISAKLDLMNSAKISSKILFVDDDELVLSGLTLTVGRKYDISTAISGLEGMEIFGAHL